MKKLLISRKMSEFHLVIEFLKIKLSQQIDNLVTVVGIYTYLGSTSSVERLEFKYNNIYKSA